MLNAWDDELTTHEYRLMGHYARVAGQNGSCWEGQRTTCEKLGIGRAKLIETRDSLVAKGFINVYKPTDDDYKSTVVVEVI